MIKHQIVSPISRWRDKRQLARVIASERRPVLIYQMGKVASSTIHRSLQRFPGVEPFHVHQLEPAVLEQSIQLLRNRGIPISPLHHLGRDLYQKLIATGRPTHVITLVRDPISRNISDFFQNLDYFGPHNITTPCARDVPQLIDAFISNYPHESSLEWFDHEFKPVLGVDVYEHPFPHEQNWQTIVTEKHNVLILKHDLPDDQKTAAIAQFLELPGFSLSTANVSRDKRYGAAYSQFTASIRLPSGLIDWMLGARYTQHFYSTSAIETFRKRWTA